MRTEVLDHGYVEFIEHWGSDERIVESARMSTGKGFLGWGSSLKCIDGGAHDYMGKPGICVKCKAEDLTGDEKLLGFLYTHHHMSPFEMAGMTIEVQAPIFVFREWHRHRTQSYNEMSARYTPLPDVNYVPTVERLMMDGGKNKQAQGVNTDIAAFATQSHSEAAIGVIEHAYAVSQKAYQILLANNVPKELARLVLPVGRYSRMRASANLRNWLQFLTLRMDPAAQWEIRQFANAVGALIEEHFPRTWALFSEGAKT